MPDLLLELFSEEIPARMQADASKHLATQLKDGLVTNSYASSIENIIIESLVTPRRLSVIVKNLPSRQDDIDFEIKGPKTSAPSVALEGFLKKNQLTKDRLTERDGVYFAEIHTKGRPTAVVLKQIIEQILARFPWPKSMRWGDGETSWVRPLHNILCLFGSDVIPVSFAGLTANNHTYGHRFLSSGAIPLTSPAEYESVLEKHFVIADATKRKAKILTDANALATSKGGMLQADEALLNEVTGLVEWPVLMCGNIDAAFMDLPPEVLTTVMKSHQKYFSVVTSGKAGAIHQPPSTSHPQLLPHFIFAANRTTADDGRAIIAGNERVLRARFADAQFFWEQDRKKPLQEWAKDLSGVTFHAKIGTMAEKVERIKSLALAVAGYIPKADKSSVEHAALLCKADLVTGMVGEFAELQGIMGRYYALHQGEKPEVADAIRSQYGRHRDHATMHPVSVCIALADRLDSLRSLFAIGEKPTGSKDPYALRRAALGFIEIIRANKIRLSLKALGATDELLNFFSDRLKFMMLSEGIQHSSIDAIGGLQADDDVLRIVARAEALEAFLKTPTSANLLTAYRRAANILEIEQKKDKATYPAHQLNTDTLKEPEEKALHTALMQNSDTIRTRIAKEDFTGAMQEFSHLREPLDAFFDKIMVNCDDQQLRANRLSLLAAICETMNGVADFSVIEK